ncbi:hypothetical protein CKO38_10120 [Rhodospirillum rubrum]|nr:hypothetical protein [Rhodospirillum rubrum]MBK1677016.1 hypothetical protein [Rhodospirillum rubrum]
MPLPSMASSPPLSLPAGSLKQSGRGSMRYGNRPQALILSLFALMIFLLPLDASANSKGTKSGPFIPSFTKPVPGLVADPGIKLPRNRYWSCVPFVKASSSIALSGDGWQWWNNAEGRYDRGRTPSPGSVLVFKKKKGLSRGHVAVVRQVIDKRTVLIDHANWGQGSAKGRIEIGVRVRDVSKKNDWSATRVWYGPINSLGSTTYPTYGFIYPTSGRTTTTASR